MSGSPPQTSIGFAAPPFFRIPPAFDGAGDQLGAAATATDPAPADGQCVDYRNRMAGTNHMVDIRYD